jgi:hypothetical protein
MSNKYEWMTKEILQQDYKELGNFKLIAEKYQIPRSTVERYCKIMGVKITPKLHYTCDDNLFSRNTEESFYLAGFIAADGCINQNKSSKPNYLSICLAKKDEDHLLKLKQIMKFTGPIKYNIRKLSELNDNWKDSEQCKIDIYSKQMIEDLARFDIGQRKSLIYKFPDWLMDHSLVNHFMRGYVDGDGSFYISTENRMTKKFGMRKYSKFVFSLRGTKLFLEDFNLMLWEFANIRSITKPAFNNGIDQITYSGNIQVAKIASYFYRNANIFMDRKFQIVKELI